MFGSRWRLCLRAFLNSGLTATLRPRPCNSWEKVCDAIWIGGWVGCSICLSVVVCAKISAPTIAYSLSGLRCTCLLTFGTRICMGKNVRFFLSLFSDGHTDAAASLVVGLHSTNNKPIWKYRKYYCQTKGFPSVDIMWASFSFPPVLCEKLHSANR